MDLKVDSIVPQPARSFPKWVEYVTSRKHVVGFVNGRLVPLVTVGVYHAKSHTRSGAVVWLQDADNKFRASGFALAHGYGYDRQMRAMELAFVHAGVQLVGQADHYEEMMMCVARALCPYEMPPERLICV